MKKERYNNYDLLRIISCIAVIVIHVSVIYKNYYTPDGEYEPLFNLDNSHILSTIIWNTLPRFAVPCFVMISGAFLLSNSKNKDFREFYLKCFKKIGIPMVIFSIVGVLYSLLTTLIKINATSKEWMELIKPVKDLIIGAPFYHLWYLYMIMWLYVLTPFIIRIKESISCSSFNKISFFIFFVSWASGYTSKHQLNWDIGLSICYIGYFLIGVIIKENANKTNNLIGILFIFLGIIIEGVIIPIQYNHVLLGISENMEEYTLIGNFNPLIMLGSVMIFWGFSKIYVRWNIYSISKHTMNIYIFHGFILDFIVKVLKVLNLLDENVSSQLVIPLLIVVVFILSYICSIIWVELGKIINKRDRIYIKIDDFVRKQ